MGQTELLGTDGFRGIFEDSDKPGAMNPSTIAGLTHALVSTQLEANTSGPVVIGGDTRVFNSQLEQAAVAGAVAAGVKERDILRLGVAPTPAILRTAQQHGAIAAVALTASHNPAEYGGWKGTIGADKPTTAQARHIEARYWEQVQNGLMLPLAYGTRRSPDHLRRYLDDVVTNIETIFGEKPLMDKLFVADTAYGAANYATPALLERLGATVERFANDISHPINEGAGATNLAGVQQFLRERPELVRDSRFVGALINDGDADRLLGVGAYIGDTGAMEFRTLDGNRVLELLAHTEVGVVGTDYTNDASITRIRQNGTAFEFCRNGDTNVTRALLAHQLEGEDWHLGSEFSGHHVDLRWLSSGDGVRTAAWVAAYAAKNDTTIATLCESMPLFPEKMRSLELAPAIGKVIIHDSAVAAVFSATPEDSTQQYRGIYRQSGTEPKFRIWGVAQDELYVEKRTAQIEKTLSLASLKLK